MLELNTQLRKYVHIYKDKHIQEIAFSVYFTYHEVYLQLPAYIDLHNPCYHLLTSRPVNTNNYVYKRFFLIMSN